MNDRSNCFLKIRPIISTAKITDTISNDERFQNTTLRSVIKMQNDILLLAFQNYILKHKNKFYELGMKKRLIYIENAIKKDGKFRNVIKGMIIGLFTSEEYQLYTQNTSDINKRMMQLVVERIKDQIQFFEQSSTNHLK